jgi:hypothetical protein
VGVGICMGYGSGARWRKAVSFGTGRFMQPCESPRGVFWFDFLTWFGFCIRSWGLDGCGWKFFFGLYSGIWIP